jgi:general secretion pathway protein C
VTPVADDNLSDTRLTNLVLKGTIATDVPEFSVAVIADGTAEQNVYAIGDAVGSGTTLHAVYAERVVLNENGVLTNLRLPCHRNSPTARPDPCGAPRVYRAALRAMTMRRVCKMWLPRT